MVEGGGVCFGSGSLVQRVLLGLMGSTMGGRNRALSSAARSSRSATPLVSLPDSQVGALVGLTEVVIVSFTCAWEKAV